MNFKTVKTGEVQDVLPIEVAAKVDTEEYRLPDHSTIRERYVTGLYVADPETDDDFYNRTKKLLTRKDFRNAYLSIRTNSEKNAVERIPLRLIAKYNNQGKPFPIRQGPINPTDCTLYINDQENITPDRLAVIYFETKIPVRG